MSGSRRTSAVPRESPTGTTVRHLAHGAPESGRFILVSNRLPVTILRRGDGAEVRPSAGDLAGALWAVHRGRGGLWVGWPGEISRDAGLEEKIAARLSRERLVPVPLGAEQVEEFYHGFSNSTLWPLLHYFNHLALLDRKWWESYWRVNETFEVPGAPRQGRADPVRRSEPYPGGALSRAEFFRTTKKIHNTLQGREENISAAEWDHYVEVNRANLADVEDDLAPAAGSRQPV